MRRPLTALALSTSFFTVQAQPGAGMPVPGPTLSSSAPAAGSGAEAVRTITWEALVPKDWDPMKAFKGVDMNQFVDGDPRADSMMRQLREVWDNAPTNPAMVGQAVRIPGFVVPLEDTPEGVKEFLLVPYFGACVHSPPPPANQIIHVLPATPAKGLRSMDAVWVSGRLSTLKTDTYMGASSYRIDASAVQPYQERTR